MFSISVSNGRVYLCLMILTTTLKTICSYYCDSGLFGFNSVYKNQQDFRPVDTIDTENKKITLDCLLPFKRRYLAELS